MSDELSVLRREKDTYQRAFSMLAERNGQGFYFCPFCKLPFTNGEHVVRKFELTRTLSVTCKNAE